jgi:hypothetical protein
MELLLIPFVKTIEKYLAFGPHAGTKSTRRVNSHCWDVKIENFDMKMKFKKQTNRFRKG